VSCILLFLSCHFAIIIFIQDNHHLCCLFFRSFVLIDNHGNIITQRTEPSLATLNIEITTPDMLTVSSSVGSQIKIKLFDYTQEPQVTIR